MDLGDRFWSKVDRSGDCWVWIRAKNAKGYGKFSVGHRRWRFAHVLSYESTYGPPADGLKVLHTCDNPPCVRPEHLYAGTLRDNNRDTANRKTRANVALTSDDVAQIRAEWTGRRGQVKELTARYGCHRNTIWRVVTRRSWKEG